MKKLMFILSLLLLMPAAAPAQLKKSALKKIVKAGREPGMPYQSMYMNNIRGGVYRDKNSLDTEEKVKKMTQKLGYRIVHMKEIGLRPFMAVGRIDYFPYVFWFVPESEWSQYQSETGIRERNIVKKINPDITAGDYPHEGEVYFFDRSFDCKKRKLKWTGNVVGGMIDGQGMGYMMIEGDNKRTYFTVNGSFKAGLPVGDVIYAVGNTWDNDADRDVKINYKHTMSVSTLSDGLAYFTADKKKYGFIGADGKLVRKPVFEAVRKDVKSGQYQVRYNNVDILIDKELKFAGIADGVTEIPDRYFNDNMFNEVKSVTLPKSVTTLGDRVFAYQKNLESVKILGTITKYGNALFVGCRNLREMDLSMLTRNVGFDTFRDCESLRTVILPPNASFLGENSFNGCKSLQTIVLPGSMQQIYKQAFRDCASLESIVIPRGVTSLGEDCFKGCTSLTSVTLPTELAGSARGRMIFADSKKLESVTLVDANGETTQSSDYYWFSNVDPNTPRPITKSEAEQMVAPKYKTTKAWHSTGNRELWGDTWEKEIKYADGTVATIMKYMQDKSCKEVSYTGTGLGFISYKTEQDVTDAIWIYKKHKIYIKRGCCNPEDLDLPD